MVFLVGRPSPYKFRLSVEYKGDAVQLGCAVGTCFDGAAHLQHILSRGPRKLHQLLGKLSTVVFPLLPSGHQRLHLDVSFWCRAKL